MNNARSLQWPPLFDYSEEITVTNDSASHVKMHDSTAHPNSPHILPDEIAADVEADLEELAIAHLM